MMFDCNLNNDYTMDYKVNNLESNVSIGIFNNINSKVRQNENAHSVLGNVKKVKYSYSNSNALLAHSLALRNLTKSAVTPSNNCFKSVDHKTLSQFETTLFIGNLDVAVDEDQLLQIFMRFGKIIACIKRWPNFGFVKFDREEDACRCFMLINGHKIKGRPMRLEFQKAKNETKKCNKFNFEKSTIESNDHYKLLGENSLSFKIFENNAPLNEELTLIDRNSLFAFACEKAENDGTFSYEDFVYGTKDLDQKKIERPIRSRWVYPKRKTTALNHSLSLDVNGVPTNFLFSPSSPALSIKSSDSDYKSCSDISIDDRSNSGSSRPKTQSFSLDSFQTISRTMSINSADFEEDIEDDCGRSYFSGTSEEDEVGFSKTISDSSTFANNNVTLINNNDLFVDNSF